MVRGLGGRGGEAGGLRRGDVGADIVGVEAIRDVACVGRGLVVAV